MIDMNTWFGRSRRKLRSTRGEYWVDDTCSATKVSPSTSAMIVMTAPTTPMSSVLASSSVPWNSR